MGFGVLAIGFGLLTIWAVRNPDWYGPHTRFRNLIDVIGLPAAQVVYLLLGLISIGCGLFMFIADIQK